MEILVLYGGDSSEREVSLRSGERVSAALRERGHTVCAVDARGEAPRAEWIALARRVDAVFLCFHGGAGEDGRWQAALERAGVFHYTGSDARASALAMDKPRAKACVSRLGVLCARGAIWRVGEAHPPMGYPFIVKPCGGGSSVGFQILKNEEQAEKLVPSEDLLCESYLPGREYSVGVLQGCALPPVEICPQNGVYDYEHKYTQGATRELCPAPVCAVRLAELQNLAQICFVALGLRDFARIDFKEDSQGRPCFLEANTLPGMTVTSLLPLAAGVRGIGFGELCQKMAEWAKGRKITQQRLTIEERSGIM